MVSVKYNDCKPWKMPGNFNWQKASVWSNDHTEIKVNGKHIKSDGSVTLLGIENDKQIKFWKAYFYAMQQKRRSNKYFNQVKIF